MKMNCENDIQKCDNNLLLWSVLNGLINIKNILNKTQKSHNNNSNYSTLSKF